MQPVLSLRFSERPEWHGYIARPNAVNSKAILADMLSQLAGSAVCAGISRKNLKAVDAADALAGRGRPDCEAWRCGTGDGAVDVEYSPGCQLLVEGNRRYEARQCSDYRSYVLVQSQQCIRDTAKLARDGCAAWQGLTDAQGVQTAKQLQEDAVALHQEVSELFAALGEATAGAAAAAQVEYLGKVAWLACWQAGMSGCAFQFMVSSSCMVKVAIE